MSFEFIGGSSAVDGAVQDLIDAGVATTVAAGNSSRDSSIASPARLATAITVGASANNDSFGSFSNFGPGVDIIAPGVSITSVWNGDDSDTHTINGTAMASAIAAIADNSLYISGLTWHCKVMPLKWSHNGGGVHGGEAAAVDFALARGVRVLSFANIAGPDDTLSEAIRDAAAADCLFVAALGNEGIEVIFGGPGSEPEAVTVGASDKNRRRIYYSNYGDQLDLTAPGEFVPALSNDPDDHFWKYSGGSSLATAQVSASAALLLSINPEFTRRDLKLYLYAGTDDELGDETDTPGWDKYHGWGHLNLYNSVVLAMMPTKIHEASGERGTLRWKVPTRRRAEVGYQIEVSYDLETWYPIQNPEIRFEGEDAYWDFHHGDSPAGTKQKSFYRIRPTFSQDLLEAASL